jgi:hypothetical protein
MVSFFKKFRKRDDSLIDLVKLQKRGIIKPPKEVSEGSDTGSSPLGFLGSLAGAGGVSSSGSSSGTDYFGSSSSYGESDDEMKKRQMRIRMMTEKVEENSNKIFDIMQRLDLIDKRLERLERRAGIKESEGTSGSYSTY